MNRFALIVLLAFAAATTALFAVAQQDKFEHDVHAGLFPVCTSCHEGITSDNRAQFYPTAADCAKCHNDETRRKVEWTGPSRLGSNLNFSHQVHEVGCETCHAKEGATEFMDVARAKPEACLACHEPEGPGPVVHLAAGAECATCHVPLKDARALTQEQIANFPQPASHAEPGFLAAHKTTAVAADANCATCHTKESCSRCHANAPDVKAIVALGSSDLVAPLVAGKKAFYPKPADHERRTFMTQHGDLAQANAANCANCHTRNSCQQCHEGGNAADALAKLPVRVAGVGPGVDLSASGHSAHPPGFANAHGGAASAGTESCTGCHQQTFCTECHAGVENKFHPANFASRHASSVYAGEAECSSCHSRESFCQTCHTGLGLNSTGGRNTTFHNGQTLWLLQHGQPARQNMESCASCHTQSSCTRCHATNAKGGWGVSPHGSMSVAKMKDKNQVVCLRCHMNN